MDEMSEHSELGLRVISTLDAWNLAEESPVASVEDCKAFIAGVWLMLVAGDLEYPDGSAPIEAAAKVIDWKFQDPTGDMGELARLLTVFAERWRAAA
ncbi:hypothetical protein ACT3SP_01050 [Brachybacterium sp. AOP43-C2-M15]|uniref:hypothetical protein n=1 Tax=Brachybacterium sp. AOP43-C2-M15 TaxID=3457661 RepID=UPI004034DD1D